MDGQAKVQLLLELKNRMKTGLSEAKKKVNSSVGDMKNKLSELKNHHVKMFSAMRDQIPMFGNALSLLKNPYALIIAGAISLGAIIGTTTKKAAEFNHEFLAIKQLNLDKSQAQLNSYKDSIKSVAFETGQSLVDTTKAFYDIQSATGLYGQEVADITKKVGNFSLMTGAKLPDSVNQTVKAMKAFKLEAKDIDMLLASNAKTVQMGITTFDELARVQTEFAGAASGAGQSVDTANKLFAVFTSIAKDSNTAATMTKSAFEGFTQAGTVKGLKEIGVSMYNAKGEMRDLSAILGDVSGKFKGMTSQQIDEVIAKIGGPEGLRNLFVKLKTGADDFFTTFKKFDETQFDFAKALANAKGDMTVISNMARNRLGVISAEIGEKFLPIWVNVLEKVNNTLSFVWKHFDTIWSVIKNVGIALGVAKVAMIVFNAITAANPIGMIVLAIGALVAGITILIKRTEGWGDVWKGIKLIVGAIIKQIGADFENLWSSATYGLKYLWLQFKSFGQWIKGLFSNIGDAIKLALSGDFSGAKTALTSPIKTAASEEIEQLKAERQKDIDAYKNATVDNAKAVMEGIKLVSNLRWKSKKEAEAEQQESSPFAADGSSGSKSGSTSLNGAGSDSINKITGSAKQVKNITVNIDSFVKGGINTENTNLQKMNPNELEQWMTNMFLRVIRNVETSY
ncbi:phage tail tape measure protein [Carboxylicivirga linearis]|uniref:Phage tail tape measure protein n=1 Tax=Carboxylicivirga linearis TaxID=1628157 RepID=A0ABS5K0J4_9BACT|nr:phage tail tape measure protein [Carboxylicivirga linearis]MBS2100697.1 phage tail tape measure protein [Carboxylicivirga linearis]